MIMRWSDQAACRNEPPDLFFPDPGGRNAQAAKKVCARCPVVADCLEDAFRLPGAEDEYGVRGGLSANQRRRIRQAAA